jgi:hypothetical protein
VVHTWFLEPARGSDGGCDRGDLFKWSVASPEKNVKQLSETNKKELSTRFYNVAENYWVDSFFQQSRNLTPS